MYLQRADKFLENRILNDIAKMLGNSQGLKVYIQIQNDGHPLRNDNGHSAITVLSDDEVHDSLLSREYLFVLERPRGFRYEVSERAE